MIIKSLVVTTIFVLQKSLTIEERIMQCLYKFLHLQMESWQSSRSFVNLGWELCCKLLEVFAGYISLLNDQ
jgi:hypothetical protein